MSDKFSSSLPGNIFFGFGEISKLNEISKNIKDGKIILLTDQGVRKSGICDLVLNNIKTIAGNIIIIDGIPAEPYDDEVTGINKNLFGMRIDLIIAVGGGSVMDTAKLISVMLKNNSSVSEIIENGVNERGIPVVMIPTTSGTGSEATPNSIIAIRGENIKKGIISRFFLPDYVILDPQLTVSLPKHLTASTGVDALCHVLECYISKKANLFSDMIALEGIRLILSSLKKSFIEGSNIEARSSMLLASFYGGAAIASSGTTAVHALSYPLGGKYRVPHGVANAVLLAPVMDFNKEKIIDKLAIAAETAGIADKHMKTGDKADLFIWHLYGLVDDLAIQESFDKFNIPVSDIPSLSESAFNVRRLLDNNPKEMTVSDIENIYKKVLRG